MANGQIMNDDGSIKVRPGDTISGISSKIYGIPVGQTKSYWKHFGRLKNGAVSPLDNPNLIYAGETIYHLPIFGKTKSAQVSLPETQIGGIAWGKMRFRLVGASLSLGIPKIPILSVGILRGQLQVQFDNDEAIYAWSIFHAPLVGASLSKLPFGGGEFNSVWSTPIEFRVHKFEPREYWRKVYPALEIVFDSFLGDYKFGVSRAKLMLKWAAPLIKQGQEPVIRHNNTYSSTHLSAIVKIEGTATVPQPDKTLLNASAGNLTGFGKTNLKKAKQ